MKNISPKNSFCIYLVDDDKFLLDMYALKFKAEGYAIATFVTGEDVLAALRKDPAPDALILDVVMPGLTGFDVLKAVKQEKLAPESTIIMLTNQGHDSEIEQAKELGVAGYIIKASSIPSEVVAKTAQLLAKRTK